MGVAQLVERRVVIPVVVGSSPIVHPISFFKDNFFKDNADMNTILITGFGPFGHTPINPAEKVAQALDGEMIDQVNIVSSIVPCIFFKSIEATITLIKDLQPDAVVMLGEYGGRSMITVERIAQNFNDSTRYQLTDNAGEIMQGQPTIVDGPTAYHSTLPIRAMVTAMRQAAIPADISDVAGTHVCNHLFYGVLHHIAIQKLPIRAGWIHLPFLPSTAALAENLGAPSMSIETATSGLRAGLQALIEHKDDLDQPILSYWQI